MSWCYCRSRMDWEVAVKQTDINKRDVAGQCVYHPLWKVGWKRKMQQVVGESWVTRFVKLEKLQRVLNLTSIRFLSPPLLHPGSWASWSPSRPSQCEAGVTPRTSHEFIKTERQTSIHTHTYGHFLFPVGPLPYMSLDSGRKLEYLESTYAVDTGGTCKLWKERPGAHDSNLQNLLGLWWWCSIFFF